MAILLFSFLSGCSSDDPGGGDPSGPSTQGTAATTGTGTTDPTSTGAPTNRTLTFSAPVVSGSTPLNVTFSLAASGTDSKTQWRLSFGDGSQSQTGKGSVPTSLSYVYNVGGNFTASFNVTWADGEKQGKSLAIHAIAPAPPAKPDVTHFELPPSAGCAGDILELAGAHCISFTEGPEEDPIDGHWVPLDSRYWGLTFTSDTTANPDSDCVYVAEDQTTILGDGHNGSGLCTGVIPELTMWLFIYPYGAGDPGMTVDFEV